MSYVTAYLKCFLCNRSFTASPSKVPGFRPSELCGEKVHICESCFKLVNKRRVAVGMEPFVLLAGAYDADEEHI